VKLKPSHNKILGTILALAVIVSVVWDSIDLPDASKRIEALLSAPTASIVTRQSLDHTAAEIDILGEALAIKNVYQIKNQHFLVLVLDGAKNRQAVHDPMHCFYSGGWSVDQSTHLATLKGAATELKIRKPDRKTEVLYWFSDGNKHHHSPLAYWIRATLRRLTLGLSGEEQVLIVIQKLSDPQSTYWSTLFDALPKLNEI